MTNINREHQFIHNILATDLDGTLIPLPDSPENRKALQNISKGFSEKKFKLIFCTGRHFSSVLDAIHEYTLPKPEWIICDVGTSIFHNKEGRFTPFTEYADHLGQRTLGTSREKIESLLEGLEGLMLQQEDHQRPFKISYACASEHTDALVDRVATLLKDFNIPFEASGSIDPFLDCGLIDLLPTGVSKAYALSWLAEHAGYRPSEVLYAGDSGNDLPALTSGCRAIVVANASKGLLEKVKENLQSSGKAENLFAATETASSGVLQGLKHFGFWE